MRIAVIGTGNVGGTLARRFQEVGHTVVLGVRNPEGDFKGREMAVANGLSWLGTAEAVAQSEVVVISAPAQVAHEVARSLGNVSGKVIIDTMNGVFMKPEGFSNTADAILANCNSLDVVKCFNTTGFENMANPVYQGQGISLFVCGDSARGKEVATQLGKDIGFGEVLDFGGNGQFALMEQLALCWINLAILQKQGRDLALTVVRR